MERRESPFLCGIKIVPGLLLLMCFHVPRLYADHDTSLRTDLNFSYTFNEQFQTVSYVFIQANENISNYNYGEWGIGLQYQTPLSWLSFLIYYQQGYSKALKKIQRLYIRSIIYCYKHHIQQIFTFP